MIEAEAKTKWCFAAVASHTDPRAGFHDGDKLQDHNFNCIGSRCMAWRWNLGEATHGVAPHDQTNRNDGHCGLAGTP